MLEKLPPEILCTILRALTDTEVINLRGICKSWKESVDYCGPFWKMIKDKRIVYLKHAPYETTLCASKNCKTKQHFFMLEGVPQISMTPDTWEGYIQMQQMCTWEKMHTIKKDDEDLGRICFKLRVLENNIYNIQADFMEVYDLLKKVRTKIRKPDSFPTWTNISTLIPPNKKRKFKL